MKAGEKYIAKYDDSGTYFELLEYIGDDRWKCAVINDGPLTRTRDYHCTILDGMDLYYNFNKLDK